MSGIRHLVLQDLLRGVGRDVGRGCAAAGLASALLVGRVAPSAAQVALVQREVVAASVRPPANAASSGVRRVAAGERANYEVRLAGRGVGTGSLEVLGEESIGGFKTLHAALQISGGMLHFARVNDRFDSWFDADRLFSRKFIQRQRELGRSRDREYEISPEERTFRQVDNGEVGALSTNEPLDDVSCLFYARTLPLLVGDVDTIPRYFKAGRDVIVKVLRKERVTVPAGTFETIVVQPTITNAGGLFGQGGQAELYFSDDSARMLVMLKSKVPVLGSLTLVLRDFHAAP